MAHNSDFTPRLLPAPLAAHYLGVSQSKLRSLKIPRRMNDGKRVYHIFDLNAFADALPLEGEKEMNTCDDIFGVSE